MLDSFKVYNMTTGVPSITLTKNGIGFSKAAVVKLGNAVTVKILLDYQGKKMAIQRCDEDDENATPFARSAKAEGLRWNNKDLTATLTKMMGWGVLKEGGYKIDGDYLETEEALLFDLNQAAPI